MLTTISILIFTFILFLILIFGKRYYDDLGFTTGGENNNEGGNGYNLGDNDDSSSYLSDEVIDCQETISGYEECVTIGQDLVTVSQYPANGGRACTEKLCQPSHVYDCRARGKELPIFIKSFSGNKYLNWYITECEDKENLLAVYKDQYGCKNKDIYRMRNVTSDVKWDIELKWEEYNPNIGASTWLLKILPISARVSNPGDRDSKILFPGRDSFQISAHILSEDYGINKRIWLRALDYTNCEDQTSISLGSSQVVTDCSGGKCDLQRLYGTMCDSENNCVYSGGYNPKKICDVVDDPKRILNAGPVPDITWSSGTSRLGISYTPYTFLRQESSWQNIYHVSLICQNTSNPVYYIPYWKGDDVTKIPNYDENEYYARKTDQEKECESDYKKCTSYEEFFPFHGKKTNYSFGKCVPKTSFLNKLSTELESFGSKWDKKWSPELADIVTKKCDQSLECNEGLDSFYVFNKDDMKKQFDYLVGLIPSNSHPASKQSDRKKYNFMIENEMKNMSYRQACTSRTE